MGIFDLFSKKPKTPEEVLKYKLREAFDSCAKNAKTQNVSDSLLKSSLIYGALIDLYNTLKESKETQALFTIQGLPYLELLNLELENALSRHLNNDFYKNLAFKRFEESISELTKTLKENMPFLDIVIKHPKKNEYYYAYKNELIDVQEKFLAKITELRGEIYISLNNPPVIRNFPVNANQRQMAIDFEEEFWISLFAYTESFKGYFNVDMNVDMNIINMLKEHTYYSKTFYDKLSELESRTY